MSRDCSLQFPCGRSAFGARSEAQTDPADEGVEDNLEGVENVTGYIAYVQLIRRNVDCKNHFTIFTSFHLTICHDRFKIYTCLINKSTNDLLKIKSSQNEN